MNDIEFVNLLAKRIADKGGKAYLVGGCVRDKLLNKPNKDIDVEVYNISPNTLREIINSIGTLTEHGKSFGVFGVKGYDIDIAMPRKERCVGVKHTDFDISIDPYMSVEEASRRRDLTMNAIMYDICAEAYIDPHNGIADINNGIIRHVDANTFIEDPLRVLRVAQFASRFPNMIVAEETIKLCSSMDISTLPKERIFEELLKALNKSPKPSIFFNTLLKMNQLHDWFPEIETLVSVPQNELYHKEGSVYNHTMIALDNIVSYVKTNHFNSDITNIALATICHDFGKIVATETINGVTHSYGHENYSAEIAKTFISRLTNDKSIINYVTKMASMHMKPHQCFSNTSKLKKTNRMFDDSINPFELIILAYADTLASECDNRNATYAIDEFYWLINRYEMYCDTMSKPYVKGSDLVDNGLKPGKYFSELLTFAHKLRLANIPKDEALKQVLGLSRKVIGKC